MRLTEASARPRQSGGRRRLTTAGVAAAVVLGLGALATPAATADRPDEPEVPSRAQVERAQSDAQEAANGVAEIQADLALANAELEASAVQAAQAFEAYNGARWAADQATEQLQQATQDARRAKHELADQRDEIAVLVATSYQHGSRLSTVDAVLGADGPAGVMDQLLAYEGASTSMDAQLQRFTATADLAEVFQGEAEEARQEKLRLLEEAELAKDAAAAAAQAAQAIAASVATRKAELIAELARLEGVSVALAERRQSALEEIERQQAVEAARQAAEEAGREEQLAQDYQPESQPESEPDSEPQSRPEPETQEPAEQPDPEPSPVAPAPVDTTPPAPSGGAAAAIAFAQSQRGDPYVWGAAGPDSWDCSGLTMAAWAAGGVSLPHYSVAQYDATTPVSAASLRAGDLLFWGSTSSPSSIFHVGLYVGGGMMIHAPRTGRPVTLESMYYWVPPTFFGRV
jgi:cell wall-associated NlpC family hydrolase